jgi:hypothetical protein
MVWRSDVISCFVLRLLWIVSEVSWLIDEMANQPAEVRKRQLSLLDMFQKRHRSEVFDDLVDSVPVGVGPCAATSVRTLAVRTVDVVNAETTTAFVSSNPPLSHSAVFNDPSATDQAALLDIGLYVGKHDIADNVKYQLLKQPWRPDATCRFPKIQQSGQIRSFFNN